MKTFEIEYTELMQKMEQEYKSIRERKYDPSFIDDTSLFEQVALAKKYIELENELRRKYGILEKK